MSLEGYTTRTTCRVCGLDKLTPLFSLGDLYVSTFVDKPGDSIGKAPLEMAYCENCTLLQLKYTAPQELMYSRHYWYRSGINPVITNDLKEIAEVAQRMVPLQPGDVVLDIGTNDGTMLKFYPDDVMRVGCEPADNLIEEVRKITPYVIHDFWSKEAWAKLMGEKEANIVTAIGMFYDMEDPGQFIKDASKVLDENGLFIAQLMCLRPMLEKNDVGNICVKPDTLILGDNTLIKELEKGAYAFGQEGKLAKVKAVMNRPYAGELVQIKPMYLEPISTTPEHPIRIVRKEYFRYDCGQLKSKRERYHLEWVSAKEVRRGDWVVMPKLVHGHTSENLDLMKFNQIGTRGYRGGLTSFPLNEEIAWLLGLYVAEGHIGGKHDNPYINFTLHEKEGYIEKRITSVFQSIGYKTLTVFPESRESMEVRVVCAALARALPTWVGKGACNKYIPDFIMLASKEIKIAFLRGLFDGDGYIKRNKVHLHTSSKILALQVQLLVASLGGMLGISYVKPYQREIRGGVVRSKDSWQLRGSSKILAEIFGYEHKGQEIPHVVEEEKYILVPVKRVTSEEYKGPVFNIETEDETYLVSNAVVHNCHEHLEYYSYESLKYLFEHNGLEIFKVEENSINGGSYRLFARHLKEGSIEYPEQLTKRDYQDFYKRIEENKRKCVEFIKNEVVKGKKVYVYGASTKGNTILQYYGLDDSLIAGAADKSEEKWRKYTVGTNISIMPEEEARKKADYFFVLPWAFFDAFYEREKEWLQKGGKFIVSIPEFRVVGL